jgi:hypothetical protein
LDLNPTGGANLNIVFRHDYLSSASINLHPSPKSLNFSISVIKHNKSGNRQGRERLLGDRDG